MPTIRAFCALVSIWQNARCFPQPLCVAFSRFPGQVDDLATSHGYASPNVCLCFSSSSAAAFLPFGPVKESVTIWMPGTA